MMDEQHLVFLELPAASPIVIDEARCTRCGSCIESCQVDVLAPGETGGAIPRVFYPGECWYCGCCVMDCPTGAIQLRHPLMNQVNWIEKRLLANPAGNIQERPQPEADQENSKL
jgi:NAD-dependent dihydropyrimidine dehydrogenase PreA subunit